MPAVQISRHGGPEELVPAELADPVAAEGQVAVRNVLGYALYDKQKRIKQVVAAGEGGTP